MGDYNAWSQTDKNKCSPLGAPRAGRGGQNLNCKFKTFGFFDT